MSQSVSQASAISTAPNSLSWARTAAATFDQRSSAAGVPTMLPLVATNDFHRALHSVWRTPTPSPIARR